MKKNCLIVISNFYPVISNNLLKGSKKVLKDNKIKHDLRIVDGCFEIPQLVNILLKRKKYSFCVVLGCIIKGQTPHFSLLSKTVINEIMQISVKYNCPIGYGIISCINKKQAIIRSSGKKNKGAEAAKAAISILKNI